MKFKIRLRKKDITYLIALVSIVLAGIFGPQQILVAPLPSTNTVVVKVIDGDTIEIGNKQKIRYIGINTPELHDPKKSVECYAKEAYEENKRLVEGKTIRLEKDVSETDKYRRLLRYVWVGDIFVNEYLVRSGFAQVSTFPPDVKYAGLLLEAQKEAKENQRGLWSTCPSRQK